MENPAEMRFWVSKQATPREFFLGRIATSTWASSRPWASTWVVPQRVWRICRTGLEKAGGGAGEVEESGGLMVYCGHDIPMCI